MKFTWLAVAISVGVLAPTLAAAEVELGRPEFPNYLTPPGRATCDWWTSAWSHACPGIVTSTPTIESVPDQPKAAKKRSSKKSK